MCGKESGTERENKFITSLHLKKNIGKKNIKLNTL